MKTGSILIALFCCNVALSQLPATVVQAPTLEGIAAKDAANGAESLVEASKQTTELKRTADAIKESSDWVKNVNSVISTGQHANNIIKNVSQTGVLINDIFGEIEKAENKGLSKRVVKELLLSVNDILINNETISIDFNDLVVSGRLLMDDAARLQFLKDLEENSRKLRAYCFDTLIFIKRL